MLRSIQATHIGRKERNWKNNDILASFPTIELVIVTVENPSTTQIDITINSLSLTLSTTWWYLWLSLTGSVSFLSNYFNILLSLQACTHCSFSTGCSSHFWESLKSPSNCLDFSWPLRTTDAKSFISNLLPPKLQKHLIKLLLGISIWIFHSHLKISISKTWKHHLPFKASSSSQVPLIREDTTILPNLHF